MFIMIFYLNLQFSFSEQHGIKPHYSITSALKTLLIGFETDTNNLIGWFDQL